MKPRRSKDPKNKAAKKAARQSSNKTSKTKYNQKAKFKSKMPKCKTQSPKTHTKERLETKGALGGQDTDRSMNRNRSINMRQDLRLF